MKSGIYTIRCLPTGKAYIGSSVSVRRRLREHFRLLGAGEHENPKLQAAFCKYGPEAFVGELIEAVSPDDRLRREQDYLDGWFRSNPHLLFNLLASAVKPPNFRDLSPVQQQAARARTSRQSREFHATPGFTEAARQRIQRLNADPVFAEANRRLSSERMTRLNRDPEFRAHVQENLRAQGSAVMTRLHADEGFRERHLQRLRKINADPESRRRCVQAVRAANSKGCKCTSPDGQETIYPSVAAAALATGLNARTVGYRCRHKSVGRDGSVWEFT